MPTKNLILCAANRYFVTTPNGEVHHMVVADNCHFGNNMRSVLKLLKELGCELQPDKSDGDRGQGFLDESGNYHSRSEAYKVATTSGQTFNPEYTLPQKKLDSSCIRHFNDNKELLEYIPRKEGCCQRYEMLGECECGAGGVDYYYSDITEEKL